jgi:hypothetical protein
VRRFATLGVLLVLVALPAGGQAATKGRVCGTLRASLPYSRHGSADRWRVYVSGSASCRGAEETLDAVMHERATLHQGQSEAATYFSYRSWSCPAGNMGVQTCVKPHRTPPYAAQALAVDCHLNPHECSAVKPPSWFPG